VSAHEPPEADTSAMPEVESLLPQGTRLLELLFSANTRKWCHRRALLFEFIGERRGEWTVNVDFDLPDVESLPLLTCNEEGKKLEDRILLPLMTFPKDLLPLAQVSTRDETDTWLSIEGSRHARKVSFAVLLAAGDRGGICMNCGPPLLWDLTSADTVVAHKAWVRLGTCVHESGHTAGGSAVPHPAFIQFAMIARLLHRSVFLLLAIPTARVGTRKIVTATYDGPIRVTRRISEALGISPRIIAPRAAFGGNAESYHLQVLPAERLTVVDSRIIYSYFGPSAKACSGDRRIDHRDVLFDRAGLGILKDKECQDQWWEYVEGPAEPMSAHVRCSSDRLPTLEEGRDAYGVFQLSPQFSGVLTQYRAAGVINLLFVLGFALSILAFGGPLRPALLHQPEAIMIVAALVAGFGVSLTIYPKEHLLTSAVMRPWRYLIAFMFLITIAVPTTCLLTWRNVAVGEQLNISAIAIWVEAGFDVLAFILLLAISVSPWLSETTGGPYWRTTGLRLRRSGSPGGKVLDDREVAQREGDPKYVGWVDKRDKAERKKADRLEQRFVSKYLIESHRRELFNRGIPPSTRHARDQRAF